MATSSPCLSSLPTELLEGVLSHLQIKQLLHVSTVSQRIHASAEYLVQQRFRHLEDLDGHNLIFECSPPSDRRITPYHTCRHNGASPMDTKGAHNLSSIYAHFTPLPARPECDRVYRTLPFDTSAYFTQLLASAVLAKRVGGATTVVGVVPETFFRIRKTWLREAVKKGETAVMWLDEGENVGLRLGVREVRVQVPQRELLVFQREEDEDERATSFEVAFEEVCVRMGYLVGMVEEAEVGEVNVLR